jgi:puromycin-sensitive aminopeptidase
MPKTNRPPFRLPKYIKPKSYHLELVPDLVAQTYTGNVAIDINISKKTDTIFLHAKDLNIQNVFLRNGKNLFETKTKENKEDSTLEIKINKNIIGSATILISFTGIIHNDLRGFYISKYDYKGKEETIGATQFEPIDARRAFPCFDEPNMKAVFNLRIKTPKDLHVLANTEVIEKNNMVEEMTEYVFAPTPVMSTYLLAWCIGKFETISSASGSGTMVNINTPLGKINHAKFALEISTKILDYFEDYFGIPYPLKKLDLIALPDFASGAMENWGLITFRETCLLVDKKNSSLTNQSWVALIIAHEIAHQWFGNLVTMDWWDDLWLNEGFANYIEYAAIDSIYPEWKVWEDFTQGDMGDAMKLDALESSHPIEVPILDAHDIDEIFDDITYRKGASVIRMIAEYVGHKNFQRGIRSYMKANQYKNAITKNLWMHLEKSSNKPVSRIMSTWTKQAGFPVISMEESGKKLICHQCRYFRNRNISKKTKDTTMWPIPLNDGNKKELLSSKKTNTIELNKDAITLNYDESNLVHIDYSLNFIERQKESITSGKLTPIQRMGLIRNMRALAENGNATAIELVEYFELFKNEKHHLVLSELWGSMVRVMHVFGKDESVEKMLVKLYANLFENMWQYFSWDSSKRQDKLRSSIILAAAYRLNKENIINEALSKFNSGINNVAPHLRASVYRIVVRHGKEEHKAKLWLHLEKETLHEEKLRIMSSFTAVSKARDLIDVLDYYNGKEVKKQDTPLLIARLLNETNNPEIVWNYIEHHWGEFLENYGKGGHLLTRILGSLSVIRDMGTMKHMKEFFKKYPAPGAKMTLNQVYEKIEASSLYYEQDARKLESYLKEKLATI